MQKPKQHHTESTIFDKIKNSIQNFFHPTTVGAKQQRNKNVQNMALFAASTVALIALQKQISKAITIETTDISRPKLL